MIEVLRIPLEKMCLRCANSTMIMDGIFDDFLVSIEQLKNDPEHMRTFPNLRQFVVAEMADSPLWSMGLGPPCIDKHRPSPHYAHAAFISCGNGGLWHCVPWNLGQTCKGEGEGLALLREKETDPAKYKAESSRSLSMSLTLGRLRRMVEFVDNNHA